MKSIAHALLSAIFTAPTASAFADGAINVGKSGTALQGYDPVLYRW